MELYTNSKPLLISDNVSSSIDNMITKMMNENKSIFQKLYDNVIYPNMGLCIIILLIVVFLLYRYYKHGNTQQENFREPIDLYQPNPGRIKLFDPDFDNPNVRIARPTFNPSVSFKKQTSYVNYLPDEIPVNVNGKMTNNIQKQEYPAPEQREKEIQYGGPYYQAGQNGISDEMYNGFVEANQQNLFEFDDLLNDKINVAPKIIDAYN